jgi:hypothetical protein
MPSEAPEVAMTAAGRLRIASLRLSGLTQFLVESIVLCLKCGDAIRQRLGDLIDGVRLKPCGKQRHGIDSRQFFVAIQNNPEGASI